MLTTHRTAVAEFFNSIDPEQTFPCRDTDGALFALQALTPAEADAQERS
ncbi:hypothetical protein [Microvirga soli]|nr:hypothetical protein [Microvirga soli]